MNVNVISRYDRERYHLTINILQKVIHRPLDKNELLKFVFLVQKYNNATLSLLFFRFQVSKIFTRNLSIS